MFRKIIFWLHLACGVSAGLVILMMSLTGVILTYERQILDRSISDYHYHPEEQQSYRPLSELVNIAREYDDTTTPSALTLQADKTAPVSVQLSRNRNVYINPYTGEVLGEGRKDISDFFRTVTAWHRWFNVQGENRDTARAVTGICNLMFLFLVCSGMYLWVPRRLKWPFVRAVLFFNNTGLTGKARDFNWHNVFGIWSAIPLLAVVATAVVFSYPWANNLVYQIAGEEPPGRGPRGAMQQPPAGDVDRPVFGPGRLDELFKIAAAHTDSWKRISLQIPRNQTSRVSFTIDQGNGGQPHKRHQLTLHKDTGEILNWAPFSDQSTGRQVRIIIRFLHTGEALGIIGQTIAGLVSLTSMIMIWTGIALAYRRLVQPVLKRNSAGKKS